MKLSSWSCSRQAVTIRTKHRPVMQLKYSLADKLIERRQLDPVVHAVTATDTALRESEAKEELFKKLTKYWSYWSDQALTIESQAPCPRDLLFAFAQSAEGLCGARAASS